MNQQQPSDDAEANPYQSPRAESLNPTAFPATTTVKAYGLARASLILAIFIEVLPVEADLLWSLVAHGHLLAFLVVKAACLTLILSPLAVYLWLNGWEGVRAAKGRIAAVVGIVSLKLVVDLTSMYAQLVPR